MSTQESLHPSLIRSYDSNKAFPRIVVRIQWDKSVLLAQSKHAIKVSWCCCQWERKPESNLKSKQMWSVGLPGKHALRWSVVCRRVGMASSWSQHQWEQGSQATSKTAQSSNALAEQPHLGEGSRSLPFMWTRKSWSWEGLCSDKVTHCDSRSFSKGGYQHCNSQNMTLIQGKLSSTQCPLDTIYHGNGHVNK